MNFYLKIVRQVANFLEFNNNFVKILTLNGCNNINFIKQYFDHVGIFATLYWYNIMIKL